MIVCIRPICRSHPLTSAVGLEAPRVTAVERAAHRRHKTTKGMGAGRRPSLISSITRLRSHHTSHIMHHTSHIMHHTSHIIESIPDFLRFSPLPKRKSRVKSGTSMPVASRKVNKAGGFWILRSPKEISEVWPEPVRFAGDRRWPRDRRAAPRRSSSRAAGPPGPRRTDRCTVTVARQPGGH